MQIPQGDIRKKFARFSMKVKYVYVQKLNKI